MNNTNTSARRMLDEGEIAALLGVSVERLASDRRAARGLPFQTIGGRPRYDVTAVLHYLAGSARTARAVALVDGDSSQQPIPPVRTAAGACALLKEVIEDLEDLKLVASLASLRAIEHGCTVEEARAATTAKQSAYDLQLARLRTALAALSNGGTPETFNPGAADG
ncbi:MAG: hypothetical protein HYS27_11755 [Deltaproteobacteria bacterium]|nr:hypothetical protein [Deltaproteobacteria bacterium]